ARFDEAVAFFEPEIQRLGAARVRRFVAQEPALEVHRHPLDRTLRAAPHTLDAAGEALVARFGDLNDTGDSIYRALSDADMPWPKIKLAAGEEITLDQTAYTKHRAAPSRDDRKQVMDSFFGTWKTYERTVGATLYAQLRQERVVATVRKYPDSISRALDRERVPAAVYDTLVARTNAHLPTLHRYLRLRARLLGVKDLRYYDMYAPLVHGNYPFPLARGRQLFIDAVAPLGPDYVQALQTGLASRWMDTYPRPRKRSGAHASSAYGVHPYVLMNYNDDYDSVTTLAHEWGHAMHSYLAERAQPFVLSLYATFTAEIAAIFNEALLLDHLLKITQDDTERLFYLGSALESIRTAYFRQTMFAEFEREIHARVDRGEPLTGQGLTKAYCGLLRRYHGDAVAIDDTHCLEWAYIPHFYSAFYVYQYATSIAAATLFAEQVARGDAGARERYLGLLKAGGSNYPYELVKAAGVDLATPAPYDALDARMNRIMDEIEAILARRSGS
ncbi:MAG TPA: M3 family oligoendopeptidase, partial [Burkholderiaceae bacterium]|nr:M3 family oligoendopeptidase [Burkholderiaceae bacterium]